MTKMHIQVGILVQILLLTMSKRKLEPTFDHVPENLHFREDMADLMLSNEISFKRGRRVCANAIKSGSTGVSDVARAGNHGKNLKNVARDALRLFLKRSKWPPVYMAKITGVDPITLEEKQMQIPFWLPHELIFILESKSLDPKGLKSRQNLDHKAEKHFQKCCKACQVEASSCYSVGMWIDGVPFNNDRSKSIEVGAFNFPGLQKDVRLPLFVLPKDLCCPATWEGVAEVIKWSMTILTSGQMPLRRHNGDPWSAGDSKRKGWASLPVPHTFLVQVKGDWACYKQIFQLTGWKESIGCCFRCNITNHRIHECGAAVSWKQPMSRLTHVDNMARIWQKGQPINHFWGIPFFTCEQVYIDWLHTADLGVSQLFLGSLFTLVLETIGGDKHRACKTLWTKIQNFYKVNNCQSRLIIFKLSMLKGKNNPKLRSKAGECRDLVPFGVEIAAEHLGGCEEHEAAKLCATLLAQCYQNLSKDSFDKQELLSSIDKFALQYAALSSWAKSQGINRWPIKPKFHLMQEMIFEAQDTLSKSWTYQEESWGGLVAAAAKRRGGKFSFVAIGKSTLLRFAAQNELPCP